MPGHILTPLDCPHLTLPFCFTRFGGMSWYRLTPLSCTHWLFLFFTRFGSMPGNRLTTLDCPHWTFLLCFTRFGFTPDYRLIPLKRFYCVLHALEPCEGPVWLHWIAHTERCYCLYTLWRHASIQFDYIGLSTLSVSILFYMRWRHARVQIDSTGLPTLSVGIAFHTLWQNGRVQIDSIVLPTLYVSRMFYTLWRHECQATDWFHCFAHAERFYCVLHAWQPCQATVWLHWISLTKRLCCVLHALEACQGTGWLHWVAHIERFYYENTTRPQSAYSPRTFRVPGGCEIVPRPLGVLVILLVAPLRLWLYRLPMPA